MAVRKVARSKFQFKEPKIELLKRIIDLTDHLVQSIMVDTKFKLCADAMYLYIRHYLRVYS